VTRLGIGDDRTDRARIAAAIQASASKARARWRQGCC
jgi:hypothetical protein